MMTRGRDLTGEEAGSDLQTRRASGTGLQRPCDQRTSGEGARVRWPFFLECIDFAILILILLERTFGSWINFRALWFYAFLGLLRPIKLLWS